jgi:nitroreductase
MLELLKSRRIIRKYEGRSLEKEKVDNILKAALLVPSSRGRRPWEFIAVTDKELLVKLSECRQGSSAFLQRAALGVVVAADKELCDVWVEDASIAAITMQLQAHSMGLGSCWIQVRERMHNAEKSAESYIKDPAEQKNPYEDKDLLVNKLHFNGFQK